jgi:regulator of sigma E protease
MSGAILALLWQIPVGLCVLSFLVLVHELGHFLVARRVGVRVDAFSIGFGPRLVGLQVGETEYRICAVPFGGYVAMRGEQPGDAPGAAEARSFESVSVGRRALIAAAGPLVNILFAIFVVWVVGMAGVREPSRFLVVGAVAKGSPADSAGVRYGDTLLALDGKPVATEQAALECFALNKGRPVRMSLRGPSGTRTSTLVPAHHPEPQLDLGWSGILFGGKVIVDRVIPDGAADRAGVRAGDTIVSVDGVELESQEQLPDMVNSTAGRPIHLILARPGARLVLDFPARWNDADKRWRIGVAPASVVPLELRHYGPVEALARAGRECWDKGTAIFRFLGALLSGRVAVKNLSGPVGIVQMSGVAAKEGLQPLLDLMVLLSINLGILNFLPLVVTDGGKLVELAVEKVRGRRADRRFMEILTNVVVYLFLALAAYVTFQDLLRARMFLR